MSVRQQLESNAADLSPDILGGVFKHNLYLTSDWSDVEIDQVCRLSAVFEGLDRAGIQAPLFPNQLDYALFFDNSTRTKSSWAGASARLGGRPVIVDGSSTQVSHGETAEETGAMLGMNAHALGIRHDLILGEGNTFMRSAGKGIDDYLDATSNERAVPIVNLQCDIDHPTQTLADLCWLRERFPDGLEGKTIAVSWAYSPSYAKPLSVPQGLLMLLPRFGMHVRLAHPPGYALMSSCIDSANAAAERSGGSVTVAPSMDDACAGADIVYPKSWGPYDLMLDRVQANRSADPEALATIERAALERNRAHTDWIYDERRRDLTRDGSALYMHCLPADIGAEVSPGVMEAARLDVACEAQKKVFVIMALLAAGKNANTVSRVRELLD